MSLDPPASNDPHPTQHALNLERERLRITLASIADGVISADARGNVTYLNDVAAELTGWTIEEALGQPITTIFHIVNETSRLPTPDPLLQALTLGHAVELANHTVLISKDGVERNIDDSAAPMRDADGAVVGAVLVFRDVSERKRAHANQAHLAAIIQSSDDAIVSKSLDGVIRSWNAGATRIFGWTADEAIGKSITLIIPDERLDEERHILARIRAGEPVDHFDTVRRTKDGRLVDVSVTVSPLKDDEGHIVGASKVARDVTQRKANEAALRRTAVREKFLAQLGERTQQLGDAGDVMRTTARLLAEHLGADRCAYAEVEDEAVFVIVGDHTRGVPSLVGRWPVAAFGAECARCMRAGQPYVINDVDADRRAGDDLQAYRDTNIQAVICVPLHKEGRLVAAMAVHQAQARVWSLDEIDLVTTVVGRCWESMQRASIASELLRTVDQLYLALEVADLGDWQLDVGRGALAVSPRAAAIWGLAPGEVPWSSLLALVHPEDRQRVQRAVDDAVANRTRCDLEFRVLRAGSERWVALFGSGTYDASNTRRGLFGLVQDVTRRRQLDDELRRRADELADADRRKDNFIAVLAHELRNPLSPIRTGLEVLRLATDPQEIEAARAIMDRQLQHMVRLIDDLLDVSRLTNNKLHLKKALVSLDEVLRHVFEATRPVIAKAGHSLDVQVPSVPVVLEGDLTRLAQVLINLLNNSAKYTPAGGHITLRAAIDGDDVVVAVSDDGIGIPASALPRIFQMFSQVDRTIEHVTGGLGIGLALVKGLVEADGGRVHAESAGVGKGSTFVVRLPRVTSRAVPHAPVAAPLVTTGRARRVLLVEDNDDNAAMMMSLLRLLGHDATRASDGLEAIALAERLSPDVIFMDIGMPRLGGLEAARAIRAAPWGQSVTLVALTGFGQAADRERSRDAGCDLHLVKPVHLPDVEAVFARLDERGG